MPDKKTDLGRLNEVLFEELERLGSIDIADEKAVQREITRSKAIEGIAKTTVNNARTILEVTRLRYGTEWRDLAEQILAAIEAERDAE